MAQSIPRAHSGAAPRGGSSLRLRRAPLPPHLPPPPDESPIRLQLDRILRSRAFRSAHRSRHFLRQILHQSLAHPDDPLKEYSIAVDVFDRDPSYDPAVNNTVRVEAGRLRSRLLEYYAGEGLADPFLLEVPKGSYRVLVHPRDPLPSSAPRDLLPPLRSARSGHLWALPLAFLVGALVGYRAAN